MVKKYERAFCYPPPPPLQWISFCWLCWTFEMVPYYPYPSQLNRSITVICLKIGVVGWELGLVSTWLQWNPHTESPSCICLASWYLYFQQVSIIRYQITCVHEWHICNILIDDLVRKLWMKRLRFIGLICALQTKQFHTSLVFLVCHDLAQYI